MADPVAQYARPDLYAAGVAGDAVHRILTRLDYGGGLPPPPARWRSGAMQRAALAALAALLAIAAAAWLLVRGPHASGSRSDPVFAVRSGPPPMPAPEAERRAAAIVNEPLQAHASGPAHHADSASTPLASGNGATGAPRLLPRSDARRPAPPARARPRAPASDSDEDVTLLAAMLAHAGRQPPAPNRPPAK